MLWAREWIHQVRNDLAISIAVARRPEMDDVELATAGGGDEGAGHEEQTPWFSRELGNKRVDVASASRTRHACR